jgi:hypothetical protein
MLRRLATFPAACALLLVVSTTGVAQIIEGDAIGEDNLNDPRYYGVTFLSAGPAGNFVQSISYDISADIDGVFDLDGATNFGNALEPVVQVSSLVGLNAGDITWSFSGNQPNVITANFAPGSFAAGDEFRFACETDLFVADPCKGGNFSIGGAVFSVQLEGGPATSTGFALINGEISVATADFSNCKLSLSMPVRTVLPGGSIEVDIALLHKWQQTVQTPVNSYVFDPQGQTMLTWQSPEYTLATNTSLQVSHRFQIPLGTPPGIYEVGVGIGEMRQGLILRSMEFRVEAPPPASAGQSKKK